MQDNKGWTVLDNQGWEVLDNKGWEPVDTQAVLNRPILSRPELEQGPPAPVPPKPVLTQWMDRLKEAAFKFSKSNPYDASLGTALSDAASPVYDTVGNLARTASNAYLNANKPELPGEKIKNIGQDLGKAFQLEDRPTTGSAAADVLADIAGATVLGGKPSLTKILDNKGAVQRTLSLLHKGDYLRAFEAAKTASPEVTARLTQIIQTRFKQATSKVGPEASGMFGENIVVPLASKVNPTTTKTTYAIQPEANVNRLLEQGGIDNSGVRVQTAGIPAEQRVAREAVEGGKIRLPNNISKGTQQEIDYWESMRREAIERAKTEKTAEGRMWTKMAKDQADEALAEIKSRPRAETTQNQFGQMTVETNPKVNNFAPNEYRQTYTSAGKPLNPGTEGVADVHPGTGHSYTGDMAKLIEARAQQAAGKSVSPNPVTRKVRISKTTETIPGTTPQGGALVGPDIRERMREGLIRLLNGPEGASLSPAERAGYQQQLKEIGGDLTALPKTADMHAAEALANKESALEKMRQAGTMTEAEYQEAMKALHPARKVPGDTWTAFRQFTAPLNEFFRRHGFEDLAALPEDATTTKNKFLAEMGKVRDDILKGVKPTEYSSVIRAVENRASPKELTDSVKLAATRLKTEFFDRIFDIASTDPEVRQILKKFGYTQGYVPMMKKMLGSVAEGGSAAEQEASTMKMIHDMTGGSFVTNFAKTRKGVVPDPERELDLYKLTQAYLHGMSKTMIDIPTYESMVKIINNMPKSEAKDLATWWAKMFIGQPSTMSKHTPKVQEWINKIKSGVYNSALWGNVKVGGLNSTQLPVFGTIESGIGPTLKATAKSFIPAKWKAAEKAGTFRQFPNLTHNPNEHGVWSGIKKVLGAPMEQSEKFGRVGAKNLGEEMAQRKSLSMMHPSENPNELGYFKPSEADKEVARVERNTMFSYQKDAPVKFLHDNPLVSQFFSFPIRGGNYLAQTIYDGFAKRDPESIKKAMRAMIMLTGATVSGNKAVQAAGGIGNFIPSMASPISKAGARFGQELSYIASGKKSPDKAFTDFILSLPGVNRLKQLK
jgi:hypothetical protein